MSHPEKALHEIFARNIIGELKVSKLPISALDINSLVLTAFGGDAILAVATINDIATREFDLIINGDGKIALPPNEIKEAEKTLQVRYKEPKIYSVSSTEMPTISRKNTNRNSDGRLIDLE